MHGPYMYSVRGGVVLRPHRLEDAPAFVEMMSNPDVTRWLQRTEEPTLEEELAWIAARNADPNSIGWSIELDELCIGSVGFDAIDWRNGVATAGIFIGHPEVWGKGIASGVAVSLALYAFDDQPWRMILSGYLDANTASGRLQASIGLREVGRIPGRYWRTDGRGRGMWMDHVLTALTREEWEARLPQH